MLSSMLLVVVFGLGMFIGWIKLRDVEIKLTKYNAMQRQVINEYKKLIVGKKEVNYEAEQEFSEES